MQHNPLFSKERARPKFTTIMFFNITFKHTKPHAYQEKQFYTCQEKSEHPSLQHCHPPFVPQQSGPFGAPLYAIRKHLLREEGAP